MSVEQIQLGLSVLGGIAVALPILIRGLRLVLLAIPGSQGEDVLESVEKRLETLARVVTGLDLKRDIIKEEVKVENPPRAS